MLYPVKTKKILVIEDEEPVRENILELLAAEDFEGLAADNGWQGLELAKIYQPDLIICDIMMPEIDGYQVLSILRQNSETNSIPVIFLTARTDYQARQQALRLGVNRFLTKPCTPMELLSAIASFF